ncbi:uncharacterized protein LOC119588869 [Penaeus monodon]|uniref:uncharacterized protein LOC119588869 n=1 Tax=Penaeus monodon TaxID=6687 RepID=UPI0018A796D3|nr:uncharacterized protein LOC119588869 [Penaeus monodon]
MCRPCLMLEIRSGFSGQAGSCSSRLYMPNSVPIINFYPGTLHAIGVKIVGPLSTSRRQSKSGQQQKPNQDYIKGVYTYVQSERLASSDSRGRPEEQLHPSFSKAILLTSAREEQCPSGHGGGWVFRGGQEIVFMREEKYENIRADSRRRFTRERTMARLRAPAWVWVVAACTLMGVAAADSRAKLVENGYEGVVVGVSQEIDESLGPAIVASIKDMFNEASRRLFAATRGRAYFRSVKVLIPKSWSFTDVNDTALSENFEVTIDSVCKRRW